nr:glutathione S-transferase family protein [Frigidibacter albus]
MTGYRYSIYTRIARLALIEKGVAHDLAEADPFADPPPAALLALNPFGRVPVLQHDGFTLYETAAILRYVDAAFPGPALVPADPRAAARMAQVIGIADAHGYWPLVRQVYAHLVFRPFEGLAPDPAEVAAGLATAGPVLDALEAIAAEALQLAGGPLSLADLHLAPMIAAFASAPEGAALLAARPVLALWWQQMAHRPSMIATRTGR